jgi:hypothetical protein
MAGLVVSQSRMFPAWVFKRKQLGIAELLCIHVFLRGDAVKTWMAGTYAKTRFAL